MKILHIISGIEKDLGGPVFALKNIIALEKEMGFESEILTCGYSDTVDLRDFKAKVHIYNRTFPKRFSQSKGAKNWLKQNYNSFDLFIIHGIWAGILLESALFLKAQNKKYIIRPAGSLDPFDVRKKYYLKLLLGNMLVKKIFNSSVGLFCTSDVEAERIITYGANVKKYILPLPHKNSIQGNRGNNFRKKYNLKEEDFVFLFLSRIDYKKGLPLLLKALKNAVNIFPNIKLIIAGSGKKSYENKIKGIIDILDLRNEVIWTGFLSGEDKANCFNSSNCFILPSMNENFGNSIIEALFHGVPVVISENVYIWRNIIEKNAGWVCKYEIDSIYNVIKEVISNKYDYRVKQKNTLLAIEQFSYQSVLPVYKQFYSTILTNLKREHLEKYH